MRYDLSNLDHGRQKQFFDSLKSMDCSFIQDSYYKVFYDCLTNEFLLIQVGYVVKNTFVLKEL